MNDGTYVEFFAVKDGVRYNAKIVTTLDMLMTLANGLSDSFEKLLNGETEEVGE